MANTINLAKVYVPIADELYRLNSRTEMLTSNSAMVRQGANAKEILYPQVDVSGLGDYDRNSGYTNNAVSVAWKTATYGYDRGTKMAIDVMDNQETLDVAFTQSLKTLIVDKVVPEGDAYTFATLASKPGIGDANPSGEEYASGETFLEALLKAKNTLDEAEVPEEGRVLFATSTLLNAVKALDTSKSREILNSFETVQAVPQSRFYTAIDLKDGKSDGEKTGGYAKSAKGKDLNFMVVHKAAVIKGDKHVISQVIPAASNPDADADIIKYRKYGIVDVLNNKVAGIYMSHKAT